MENEVWMEEVNCARCLEECCVERKSRENEDDSAQSGERKGWKQPKQNCQAGKVNCFPFFFIGRFAQALWPAVKKNLPHHTSRLTLSGKP